ncbi:MAG TPA: HlyD family efflux transporter periplasmic adaptor subunit [Steroidobacteraceae bacterium]
MSASRLWLRRSALVVAAMLVFAALGWALRPRPVEVDTVAVTRGLFVKTVDEEGKTRVRERYVVSAPLAGRLLRIALKPGDDIRPNMQVATLLPAQPALLDERTERELVERVGAAEARQLSTSAAAERAKVAVSLARSELARANQLGERGFVSGQAVERAERELELKLKELDVSEFDGHAAEHDLASARAALLRAREGRTGQEWAIRSPVAGRVLRVVQESEAVVPIGAPLLEVGDPREIEAVVDVLTTDAEAIRPGAAVTLDHAAGAAPLAGQVRLVEPAAFTKVSALGVEEQRVNVVIDIVPGSRDVQLGDGYRVDAHIVVDRREGALMVPNGALFRKDDAWAVFVADHGRARQRSVTLGPRNATHAVVESGLDEGTTVVVYPPDVLRDGARVRVRAPG